MKKYINNYFSYLYIVMVQSKLDSTIQYKDDLQINPEDIGYQSSQYEIEMFGKQFIIALGKPKYSYQKKNIVFYPIYIVNQDAIRGQIGLYEIPADNVINLLDEDNDIDLTKLDAPLLYDFTNKEILDKLTEHRVVMEIEKPKGEDKDDTKESEKEDNAKKDEDVVPEEEEEDDDDVTKLKLNTNRVAIVPTLAAMKESGMFEIDPNVTLLPPLDEETEKESSEIKKKFADSHDKEWVQKFFHNDNYALIDNEGGGDCFFATVRDAFSQIGYGITVKKMREVLSAEITDEIFQQYKSLYLGYENEFTKNERQMNDITGMLRILEKRAKSTDNKQTKAEIVTDAKKLQTNYTKLKDENAENRKLLEDVKFMKDITTIDDFRTYIQTNRYWADTWAISKLEEILGIKVIILSEESFEEGAADSVLNCGEANKDIEHRGSFTPKYYIIVSYSGDHYKLVSYKRKQIFGFREIPYDIKIMITNKCLERNSGIFYLIQDFRNFKSKLGIDPDVGKKEDDADEYFDVEMFNPSIIFMFHSKSEEKAKPGKGSGEEIPVEKMVDFIELVRNKTNKNWRRKLDDSWSESPFTLDNMHWRSVEHYVLGAQYKKGFPDFYKMFAEDNGNDIAKDILLARAASSKTGKLKDKQIRPKEVKSDADYEQRKHEERVAALVAKFTQNQDLAALLKYTYPAKLIHFVRGSPAEMDKDLMQLRKDLIANK